MNTTVFITHFFVSKALNAFVKRFTVFLACALLLFGSPTAGASDLTQFSVERGDDGVYLSTIVQFDLPTVVEDALLKGIPMFFVAEADIYLSRWYWADKRVANATRTIRLAYQPLTRRWRVNIVSGLINNSAGLRATLYQNYDTLPESLSAVQRFSRWRIADNSEVEPDVTHKLEFSFSLDLSQLPRPFQIGVAGQKDWTISAQQNERLLLGAVRPKAVLPVVKEADK